MTQFALGAALGESTLGKRLGRKAALWGGALGTLPDLDVLIPLSNDVASFTYHRSFSHSLFVLALLTPIIAHFAHKRYQETTLSRQRWILAIYLIFATHVLLDSLTAYGTQIFWPFITTPISISSIFIVDPLYTVPLLIGLLIALRAKNDRSLGHLANNIGLTVSTLYLIFTLTAKMHVEERIAQAVESQDVKAKAWFTTPAPFNSLLWRVVVMVEGGYYEAYYSLFDGKVPITFNFYPSDERLLLSLQESWSVQRLQWFTKGFYSVRKEHVDSLEDPVSIIVTDLRMGVESRYVFRFEVAELSGESVTEVEPRLLPFARDLSGLERVWQRIWDSSVEIVP